MALIDKLARDLPLPPWRPAQDGDNRGMNPLLKKLQPYPFERLRGLTAGVTPNPAYRPISLGIGEPRHATPELIKTALSASLAGLASYPATAGEPKLRQAMADKHNRRLNFYVALAMLYAGQDKIDKAHGVFTQAFADFPGNVEAYYEYALFLHKLNDLPGAMRQMEEVLKREPRHFGALSGFGLILQDIGDDKQALEVYRRALAIYPRLQRIPDVVKTLQEKIEGRDI